MWCYQKYFFLSKIKVITTEVFSLFLLFRISSAAFLIFEAEGTDFLVFRSGFEMNSSWSFCWRSWRNHVLKLSWENRGYLANSSVVGLLFGSTFRQADTKFMELSDLETEKLIRSFGLFICFDQFCYQWGKLDFNPVGWLLDIFTPLNIGFLEINSLCLLQSEPNFISIKYYWSIKNVNIVTKTFSDMINLINIWITRKQWISSQHLCIKTSYCPNINLKIKN